MGRTLGLKHPWVSSIVGVLLILAFTSHISYLTFVRFDYGYNMAANACFGMTNALARGDNRRALGKRFTDLGRNRNSILPSCLKAW